MKRFEKFDALARSIIAITFFASLCLPVWWQGSSAASGWEILLFGWMGVLAARFGWFGNVLLIQTLYMPPKSMIGAFVKAALFAVFFLMALTTRTLPSDNGAPDIDAYGAGYYLWLADMVLGALFCLGHSAFADHEQGNLGAQADRFDVS